jgi:urease accessory protein
MFKLTEVSDNETQADDVLCLSFEDRQKKRQAALTKGGVQVGLFLPRTQSLRSGSVLRGEDGFKVRIEAAQEKLSVARCSDPLKFARTCYHLGNRHIALQILPGELRYLADHVLDQMLAGMGINVEHQQLAFEPESGAYHSHES